MHSTVPLPLRGICELIEETFARDPWEGPALAVGVTLAEDGVDLSLKELDGHPAELLLGFRAPSEWSAFGLAVYGWAASWDPASGDRSKGDTYVGPPPSQRPDRERVLQVTVLDRSGASAERLRWRSGRVYDPEGPMIGRVPDTLRRVMGLRTDPPPATTVDLWAVLWCLAVIDSARRQTERLTWRDVQQRHLGERLDVGDDVVTATRFLAKHFSWERVRELTASGAALHRFVDADAAAWMDDGFFARELLASVPSLDDLLDEIAQLTSAGVARRMRKCLALSGADVSGPGAIGHRAAG